MVRFDYLNLAAPAPNLRRVVGTDVDLIVCRNVAIYLAPTVTRQLYRYFGEALARDGWLVLGPADPAPDERAGLQAVTQRGAVLWRPTTAVPASATRPTTRSVPINDGQKDAARRNQPTTTDHLVLRQSRRAARGGMLARPPHATRGPAGGPALPDGAGLDVARALLRAGDRGAGRAVAERLASERGLDPAVQLFLGMLYLEDGALEAALGALRRATFLAPDDALAQFTLGRALARGGDLVRARAALLQARRALAAVPETAQLSTAEPLQASALRAAVEVQLRGLETSIVD
jgi:chemotaxis protein methyltransferase CheR